MLYNFKYKFQVLSNHLAHKNMTANHATLLGFLFVILTILSFYLALFKSFSIFYLFTPVFIFLRLCMNALDGLLARAQNTASALGEILNEISDVVGDTLSYGIFFYLNSESIKFSIFFFLLSIWFCEFIGVLGKSLPGGHRRQESLGGAKPERAVFISLLSITLYFKISYFQYLPNFFYILAILNLATTFKRIISSLRDAKNKEYSSFTKFGK